VGLLPVPYLSILIERGGKRHSPSLHPVRSAQHAPQAHGCAEKTIGMKNSGCALYATDIPPPPSNRRWWLCAASPLPSRLPPSIPQVSGPPSRTARSGDGITDYALNVPLIRIADASTGGRRFALRVCNLRFTQHAHTAAASVPSAARFRYIPHRPAARLARRVSTAGDALPLPPPHVT